MLNLPQKHEVIYFRPGELVFLVKGNSGDESNKDVLKWANSFVKERSADISISQREALNFEPRSQEHSRLHKEQIRTPGKDLTSQPPLPEGVDIVRRIIRPDVKIPEPFALIPADVQGTKGDADLLDLILLLDKNRKKAPGRTLLAVSPNWLASGSSDSEPGSTGGPGGRPSPYEGEAQNTQYVFQFNVSTLSQALGAMSPSTWGENVVVAILDTAPKDDLDQIYDKWVTQRPQDPHSLISTLLPPNNRHLTVHSNTSVDSRLPNVWPNGYIQVDGHDYEMSDHGLFVAGIIHSLAPKAELHLFQVLNRYGVGDLLNIARALQQVYDGFSDRQLVINLSLNLNLPIEDGHINNPGPRILDQSSLRCRWLAWEKIRNFFCRLLFGPSWFERQAWTLEWICDLIYSLNSRVIAAAGNDYNSNQQVRRPQARYPAAFQRVVGVGALPKMNSLPTATTRITGSSYSNLADRPPRKGITTLGGEPGAGQGVLGIYLGQFPPQKGSDNPPVDSSNGWGWWAGTSFAAPIISGITAAALSGMPLATTQEAIEALYSAEQIVTAAGEDFLFVVQGEPL